jgi:hypothetical protein
MAQLAEDLRSSLRFFAFYLANGTVDLHLLPDPSYVQDIVEYGSALESVFAVFANVLDLDDDGRVTNADHAQRRAAQWIRSYVDPQYVVEPPFEDWEVELA